MKNLIPTEQYATSPTSIVKPGDLLHEAFEYPFPSVWRGDEGIVVLGETTVKTADLSFSLSAPITLNLRGGGTGAITKGSPWQFESFLDQWIATNRQSLVYRFPKDGGDVYVENSIKARAIGRHDYRLMLGGLSGPWFSGERWGSVFQAWRENNEVGFVHDAITLGDNYVVWGSTYGGAVDHPMHALACAIGLMGDAAFDLMEEIIWDDIEANELGIVPIRHAGKIQALRQLGNRMIVYGDAGISELQPIERGFREELIGRYGIGGPCCVGGNERRHIFVNNDGQLYSWRVNEHEPSRIGHAEYLGELNPARTIVSFDPVEGYYWITDGRRCYVLTRTGLGGDISTRPTSMFRDATYGLVGMYTTPDASMFELATVPFDMSERDFKHVDLVQAAISGASLPKCRMEGRYRNNEPMKAAPWVPFSPQGVAHPTMSFIEGQLRIQGEGRDVFISQIEIRYKGEGKRHRRGTAGVPDGL